jgi:hypothetical protein
MGLVQRRGLGVCPEVELPQQAAPPRPAMSWLVVQITRKSPRDSEQFRRFRAGAAGSKRQILSTR